MFSSNITLKATLEAEKEKERTDNRLAAKYLKIRALLDEAERAINSANIARSLKNQLTSKVLKARRALDKGLNVEEVGFKIVVIKYLEIDLSNCHHARTLLLLHDIASGN